LTSLYKRHSNAPYTINNAPISMTTEVSAMEYTIKGFIFVSPYNHRSISHPFSKTFFS